jgi:hypothetical protein
MRYVRRGPRCEHLLSRRAENLTNWTRGSLARKAGAAAILSQKHPLRRCSGSLDSTAVRDPTG